MAWTTPKQDWHTNPKNPVAADFNRIEGNVDFLKGDIETKKGAIVTALSGVGLDTSINDTHAQIAGKITAANQGTKIITPSTTNQTIAKGFHSGSGYVKGDANLVAANIVSGKTIFNTLGSAYRFASGTAYGVRSGSFDAAVTVSGLSFYPMYAAVWYYEGIYKQALAVMVSGQTGYGFHAISSDQYWPTRTGSLQYGGFVVTFKDYFVSKPFNWIAVG